MKKLQKLVLHNHTKMTAPQMKHIIGGYDGGGTCCVKARDPQGECALCGQTRAAAQSSAGALQSNWCCDSCSSASWMGRQCDFYS